MQMIAEHLHNTPLQIEMQVSKCVAVYNCHCPGIIYIILYNKCKASYSIQAARRCGMPTHSPAQKVCLLADTLLLHTLSSAPGVTSLGQ